MDNQKNFDRLNEAANDSAKRQDEVFDRIQDIVKENPESAKQYLQHLTHTSKWELYSRIYGKFAYITLLIAFLVVGLIVGIKKTGNESIEVIIEKLREKKPDLIIENGADNKYCISYYDRESKKKTAIANLTNFEVGEELTIKKYSNKEWNLFNDSIELGKLELNLTHIEKHFTGNKSYQLKESCEVGGTPSLVFRIDTSKTTKINPQDTTTRRYFVKFGEIAGEDTIWIENLQEVYKSDNAWGKIVSDRNNAFELYHDKWEKTYMVEMSIGKLGHDNYIYFLHINAYGFELK